MSTPEIVLENALIEKLSYYDDFECVLSEISEELKKEIKDDKEISDLSRISQEKINNIYVCYKSFGEYGISFSIFDFKSEKIKYILFLDKNSHEITSFYKQNFVNSRKIKIKGLKENIYSNRTEYFNNNKFYGYHGDNNIEYLISLLTSLIFNDKILTCLDCFISDEEKPSFKIISKNDFESQAKIILEHIDKWFKSPTNRD